MPCTKGQHIEYLAGEVLHGLAYRRTAGYSPPGLNGADLDAALKAAKSGSVLTIGDAASFTDAGGVIQFYLEDRKVRFEINLAAAQRAKLQISSQLLKLARVVNK